MPELCYLRAVLSHRLLNMTKNHTLCAVCDTELRTLNSFFAIVTRRCAVSRKKEQIFAHFMRLWRVRVRCHEKRSKYCASLTPKNRSLLLTPTSDLAITCYETSSEQHLDDIIFNLTKIFQLYDTWTPKWKKINFKGFTHQKCIFSYCILELPAPPPPHAYSSLVQLCAISPYFGGIASSPLPGPP